VDKAVGPGPMRSADATEALTSYGYYEEGRIIADECLSQPRALIGFWTGAMRTSDNSDFANSLR
jgi:hypothetical protein